MNPILVALPSTGDKGTEAIPPVTSWPESKKTRSYRMEVHLSGKNILLSEQKINRQSKPNKSKPSERQPNPLGDLNSCSSLDFDLLDFHDRRCHGQKTLNQKNRMKEAAKKNPTASSLQSKGLTRMRSAKPIRSRRKGKRGFALRV